MAITVPKFYPRPWAANEQLPELTEGEMVAAFPGGTEERPTRQTLNKALAYATNGVIYFLVHGVPEWSAEAQYAAGSVVRNQNDFFLATAINRGVVPYGDASVWEFLPWRKDVLDAIYLTMEYGDRRFFTFAAAEERFYTQQRMNALFMTPPKMALLYVTQAALAAEYITREEAIGMFLTVAIADERYAIYEETVSREVLDEILEEYLTLAVGKDLFLTEAGGDATLLNRERAGAVYLTLEDAAQRFEAKINAAISRYRPDATYSFGVLAFDPEERTIYRSLADDNVGHPLDDEEYWTEWTIPHREPTGAGEWPHTQMYTERGTYMLEAEDVLPPETHGDMLMRFRLKGGGGGGYEAGGGGEGAELDVSAVMEESAFPLRLVVGGPGQHSSISRFGNQTLQVNCAGDAIETWRADEGFGVGGWGHGDPFPDLPIDTSHVESPAPEAVYRSVRLDDPTPLVYTFGGFTPGAHHIVRLHFCELWTEGDWPHRRFSVVVNGILILNFFNIMEAAGGVRIANIQTTVAVANAQGQVVITFTPQAHPPIIAGIEILPLVTLLSVSPGSDATEEEPGLGGEQAMVGLGRGVLSVATIPGAHGRFAWPGFRGGDGGGWGGSSGEPLRRVNCAGGPIGTWGEDAGFDGGQRYYDPTLGIPIDLSRAFRPGPAELYIDGRFPDPPFPLTYTFGGYQSGNFHIIRLHFCELFPQSAWQRFCDVTVNGSPMLNQFDVATAAGGLHIAHVETMLFPANFEGQFNITLIPRSSAEHPPIISGIEIFPAVPIVSNVTPINCGGEALGFPVGGWEDRWFTTGLTIAAPGAQIDLSRTLRPAPMEVYQTCRYGGGIGSDGLPNDYRFRYIIPPSVAFPGWVYRLRLHFCECWATADIQRVFHIAVNRRWVMMNFNAAQIAGGAFIAIILEFDTMADAAGIDIWFEPLPGGQDPIINGIELMWMGSAMGANTGNVLQLGGGGNSEWGPAVRPGADGFIFVDW
jgi:Malectin domain